MGIGRGPREEVNPMATDLRIEVADAPGILATIGEAFGKAGVNIDGCCAVATATGQGHLHLLVDDAAAARGAVEEAGFAVAGESEVLVLDAEDRPGYLGEMARKLADAGVNIEVAYLATNTRVVFGVSDPERARQAL